MPPHSPVKWDRLVLTLLVLLALGAGFYANERRKFHEAPVVQVQAYAAHDFGIFTASLEPRYAVHFVPTMPGATLLLSIIGPRPQVDHVKVEIHKWAADHDYEFYFPPDPDWFCCRHVPSVVFHQE